MCICVCTKNIEKHTQDLRLDKIIVNAFFPVFSHSDMVYR